MIVRDGYSVDDGAAGRTCGWGRGGTRCGAPAFRARGQAAYCLKHHRFHQMRKLAKKRGILVPTWQQLEWLLHPDMVCHECGDAMLWTSPAGSNDRGATISLQHYRDGSIALIHHRCNCGHAHQTVVGEHEAIPVGMVPCPRCEQVLPESAFPRNASKRNGLGSHCRECTNALSRERSRRRALSGALCADKSTSDAGFYERGSALVPPISLANGGSR